MKRKNRYIPVSLALILTLTLTGCMSGPSETVQPSASLPEEVTPPVSPQKLQIALCSSPEAIDDASRNAACYDGARAFTLARNGLDSLTPLQESSGDPATALRAFRELAPTFDVMIFVGSTFSELSTIALENPEKHFILVDTPVLDSSGSEIQVGNICTLQYAEQECGFLAGAAAALESQTGRIAIVSDLASPANLRYYYGFRSGVAYANGNYGTTAEVIDHPSYAGVNADGIAQEGNYIGRTTDLNTGYALANSLIDEGCDILFITAAGPAREGAYAAVKDREGGRIIGAETDQTSRGETDGENVVLFSVTKDFAGYIEAQLSAIANGSFQGGTTSLRAVNDAIGYTSSPESQQLNEQTLQHLADIYPLMKDGTIVPLSGPPV